MNEARRKPTTGRQSPTLFDKWHGIFYMPRRIDEALNILPHQIALTSDVLIRSLRMESNCFNMRLCLDWGNMKVMATTVRSPLHLPFTIPVPRVLTK